MNSTRGHNPKPLIDFQPEPSDQSSQARKGRISRCDAEAEKAFARLVIYAIGPSSHFVFRTLARAGDQSFVGVTSKSDEFLQLLSLVLLCFVSQGRFFL